MGPLDWKSSNLTTRQRYVMHQKSYKISKYHSLICSSSENQCLQFIASLNPLKMLTRTLQASRAGISKNTIIFFSLKLHVGNFVCSFRKRYASHPCHFMGKCFLEKVQMPAKSAQMTFFAVFYTICTTFICQQLIIQLLNWVL